VKALIIGGTGVISTYVTALALERGWEVTLCNRGRKPGLSGHPSQEGNTETIRCDAYDPAALSAALGGRSFDVAANFIGYTPGQVRDSIRVFEGRTAQYLFISSTATYERPVRHIFATESTPQKNPHWLYARDKIECEAVLNQAWREHDFPMTIVRPAHTYGGFMIPTPVSWNMTSFWTVADRILREKPILLPGDGTSVWTLTHASDFARGFVGLMGNPAAIGQAFHITSDEVMNWNRITQATAAALGAEARIVHAPAEAIERLHPEPDKAGGVLGDKADGYIFDNSKIKRFVPGFTAAVPFWEGIRGVIENYHRNPGRKVADEVYNERVDKAIAALNPPADCAGGPL
jgi:nucleoside-diphosphate-sugar epimerase